jgi:hypothetical protein
LHRCVHSVEKFLLCGNQKVTSLNVLNPCCAVFITAPAAQDNSPVTDVETNMTKHLSNWDGIIRVVSQHYKSLDLSWNAPNSLDPCMYRVHFYSANGDAIAGFITCLFYLSRIVICNRSPPNMTSKMYLGA